MTELDDDLFMQADSMLSYLWYRGFIDKAKVEKHDGLRQDIERLLTNLRVRSDNRGNRT